MVLWKALKYAALGLALLVAASVAVSVIATAISIVWSIVTALVALLVLATIGYVGYKAYAWLSSDGDASGEFASDLGTSEATSGPEPNDPVDRLQRQYTDGRISEAEFERRLGEELGDTGDEIDRELERA